MRLRTPGSVDDAISKLTTVVGQLYDCRVGSAPQVRAKWLQWWENSADPVLRSLFADDDLVLSLYRTRNEISRERPLFPDGLAGRETNVWITRLEDLIGTLRSLKPFIDQPGHIIVPDTSAFIEGVYFTDFDWQSLDPAAPAGPVRLVIPIVVVEELDALKRDRRAGERARSVLHRIWELHGNDPAVPAALPGDRKTTVEIFLDDPWHARRPVNDEEIIERAITVKEITGKSVQLAAGDYAMLYRAAATSLNALLMPRPPPPPPPDRDRGAQTLLA